MASENNNIEWEKEDEEPLDDIDFIFDDEDFEDLDEDDLDDFLEDYDEIFDDEPEEQG